MTLVLCIVAGAVIGLFLSRRFPLGGAEWRRLCTVGAVMGSMLSYWMFAEAGWRTEVQFEQLAWSSLASVLTVFTMYRIRARKSD